MVHVEHFLFFPIVVLLAMVLVILNIRLVLRLFIYFLIFLFTWYLLFLAGFAPSPSQVIKSYRPAPQSPTHRSVQ